MGIDVTDVALIYNGSQISRINKVPSEQGFIVAVGVSATEDADVVAFIPFGSTGFITADGNRFTVRKDDVDDRLSK